MEDFLEEAKGTLQREGSHSGGSLSGPGGKKMRSFEK